MAAKKSRAQRTRSARTHRARRPQASDARSAADQPDAEAFEVKPVGRFVVGIGASAGGLEALTRFFEAMPSDTGLSFVVVTHQPQQQPSLLPELLARHTRMQVAPASDHAALLPDRVYVCPPGKDLAVLNGCLQLLEQEPLPRALHPIDGFFRSLAHDLQDRAICIVLSGTGTDGTLGLRAIKEHSGFAVVQDESSAHFAGMPLSAAATMLADYVLAPEAMPAQLLAYTGAAHELDAAAVTTEIELRRALPKIFVLLRDRLGHDFSGYKSNTMERRIERRMRVHGLTQASAYVQLLQKQPQELELLFHELLITVTQFFRDPEAYTALGAQLTKLLADNVEQAPIRVWVPGCATGEEPYSIAMLALELAEQAGKRLHLQIFATDLDPQAIAIARHGVYPQGIASDVGPERLQRFFVAHEGGYRIHKRVRDCVVFAPQNLLRDPPFTRLDLLSCRNLLIYLTAPLQQRLFPMFHYALKPTGMLWLGSSETLTIHTELFAVLDRKWKLYSRRGPRAHPASVLEHGHRSAPGTEQLEAGHASAVRRRHGSPQLAPHVNEMLVERFAPATLIVTERGDIAYIHGRTGKFLEPVRGEPKHNLLAMAREGLRLSLQAALRSATTEDREVVLRRVPVRTNGATEQVKVVVRRIADPETLRGLYRVSLSIPRVSKAQRAQAALPADSSISSYEQELERTRSSLKGTLDELQTSNESLTAANEELESTNEELQSTNEELETSKEELQSLNEELQTLNSELQLKVDELAQVNDDMNNLLNSTDIATLFLDRELRIKRFTDQAKGIVRLRASDVGRPIGDFAPKVQYATLVEDAMGVLQTLRPHETEVHGADGHWLLARILPYRTSANVIDGVVVTFVDIHRLKRAEQLAASRGIADSIVQAVRDPLLVLDGELNVVSSNRASSQLLGLAGNEIQGQSLFALTNGALAVAELRSALQGVVANGGSVESLALTIRAPEQEPRYMQLSARRLEDTGTEALLILVVLSECAQK